LLAPPATCQVKKREFRSLWIQRINAAARIYGLPYSLLMNSLQKSAIPLNRKVLADLAVTEPLSFKSVVEVAKLSTKAGASS
jgi:large subunit ribosomal protein L20